MTNKHATNKVTTLFPCPECKRPSVLTKENPYRPFCSERCKLIDLGSWAAEERKIASEPLGAVDVEDNY